MIWKRDALAAKCEVLTIEVKYIPGLAEEARRLRARVDSEKVL